MHSSSTIIKGSNKEPSWPHEAAGCYMSGKGAEQLNLVNAAQASAMDWFTNLDAGAPRCTQVS
jgi:hypothetical protein